MKIKNIEVKHLQIPLKVKFAQANNSTQTSSSLLVKLTTNNKCIGYGEACPREYVTGESIASVQQDMTFILTGFKNRSFNSITDIEQFVSSELPGKIGLSSICAIELALLDAWCKSEAVTIWEALNIKPRRQYNYTGVIPFGDVSKLKPLLKKFNFKEIKIKAGKDLSKNLEQIEAIRQIYGEDTPIRFDVNGAWNLPQAIEQTTRMIEKNVFCIEQPFKAKMIKSMRYMTANFGQWVTIMADESLTDFESSQSLIERKACTRFNIKLSKNGGIFNSLKIYKLAKRKGISCQLGAHFGETSILTAAGLVFATMVQDLKALEGGLGNILLSEDITDHPLTIDKMGNIYGDSLKKTYGLGVEAKFDVTSPGIEHQPATCKRFSHENYFRFTLSKSAFRLG